MAAQYISFEINPAYYTPNADAEITVKYLCPTKNIMVVTAAYLVNTYVWGKTCFYADPATFSFCWNDNVWGNGIMPDNVLPSYCTRTDSTSMPRWITAIAYLAIQTGSSVLADGVCYQVGETAQFWTSELQKQAINTLDGGASSVGYIANSIQLISSSSSGSGLATTVSGVINSSDFLIYPRTFQVNSINNGFQVIDGFAVAGPNLYGWHYPAQLTTPPTATLTTDPATDKPLSASITAGSCVTSYGAWIIKDNATNNIIARSSSVLSNTSVPALESALNAQLSSIISPLLSGSYTPYLWLSCSTFSLPAIGASFAPFTGGSQTTGVCFKKCTLTLYIKCSATCPLPSATPTITTTTLTPGTPPLAGTGCAGGLIDLYINGNATPFASGVPVDASGAWSIATSPILLLPTDIINADAICPNPTTPGNWLARSGLSNNANVIDQSVAPVLDDWVFTNDTYLLGQTCPHGAVEIFTTSLPMGGGAGGGVSPLFTTTADGHGRINLTGIAMPPVGTQLIARVTCPGQTLSVWGNTVAVRALPVIDTLAPLSLFAYYSLWLSRNDIVHNTDAETYAGNRADLRYMLNIMARPYAGSTAMKQLGRPLDMAENPPRQIGTTTVLEGAVYYIQQYLDDALKHTRPTFGQSGFHLAPQHTMPFFVKSTVTPTNTAKTSDLQWVFKGGIDDEDFQAYGRTFFDKYLANTRQFLTWQPDNKLVSANQPEYLYFLLNINHVPRTTTLRVQVTYTDNTTAIINGPTTANLPALKTYDVIGVAVGHDALNLGALPKKVHKWTVWLNDEHGYRLSETRTYHQDFVYRHQVQFVIFANSLFGYDTYRFYGQSTAKNTTTRSQYRRDRNFWDDPSEPDVLINEVESDRALSCYTGWLPSKQHLRWLQELVLSEDVYIVTDRLHRPVVLTTAELTYHQDEETRIGRVFDFRSPNRHNNYSALPPATGTTSGRPTAWRGVGTKSCELDAFGKRTGKSAFDSLEMYYTDNGQAVRPLRFKPNESGDQDYIAPTADINCATPAFLSTALSYTGTYQRATCPVGTGGGYATIYIIAGRYGSETSQADADGRALAYAQSLDTQLFANQRGSCTVLPCNYTTSIPAAHWHIRTNNPMRFSIYNNAAQMGNTPAKTYLWGINPSAYRFAHPTNDLDLPTSASGAWIFNIAGNVGDQFRVRVYQNCTLKQEANLTIAIGATYAESPLFVAPFGGASYTPANQDKFYIEVLKTN